MHLRFLLISVFNLIVFGVLVSQLVHKVCEERFTCNFIEFQSKCRLRHCIYYNTCIRLRNYDAVKHLRLHGVISAKSQVFTVFSD